jgi:hypothetical protein
VLNSQINRVAVQEGPAAWVALLMRNNTDFR